MDKATDSANRVLTPIFFEKPAVRVAQDLLGKYLVRRWRGKEISSMITEVEAYDGPHDKASHALRGITPRTKVMFGASGCWYAYLTYGMHWMLNIVTGVEGYPAAVLIRGTEVVSGPGRLTKYFHITGTLNKKIATKTSGLWIENRGKCIPYSHIQKSARIGVDYAGPVWAKREYRFFVKK